MNSNYYSFKRCEGKKTGDRTGNAQRASYKKSSYKKSGKKENGITDEEMTKRGYHVIACYYNMLGKQVRVWESDNDNGLVIRLRVKMDTYTARYESRQQAIERIKKIMEPGFKQGGYVRDRKTESALCAEQRWA